MTAATTLAGGDVEGAKGSTAGGKLTEWKGLKGSKGGVRRREEGEAVQRGQSRRNWKWGTLACVCE